MRDVVETTFDRVADDVTAHAWRELDPVRVATDGRKTGDTLGLGVERRVVKRLLRGPIRREMRWLRRAWTEQYRALLDGIAADPGNGAATGGAPPSGAATGSAATASGEARERFVDADPFLAHYDGPDREGFADALRGHHDRLADAIAPLVAAEPTAVDDPGDATAFWRLATAVHDEDRSRALLDDLTGHAPILADHRDGIAFAMTIDAPVVSEQSVEYGDEAVRVVREGIAAVREDEERRLERVLGEDRRRHDEQT